MFALLQHTWLHTQNGIVWNFKICLTSVHRFVSELAKCIALMWITIVQMWSYGFLEISHLAYNLKWVYWDCRGSGQNLEAPQWFIGTLSLSSQVSCCLLNHFTLNFTFSSPEFISKLTGLHLSTLEVNNAQNEVSIWQPWTWSSTIPR